MLKDLKKKKLLASLAKKGPGLTSPAVEGTPLEEQGESPKYEKSEDESAEAKKKKPLKGK